MPTLITVDFLFSCYYEHLPYSNTGVGKSSLVKIRYHSGWFGMNSDVASTFQLLALVPLIQKVSHSNSWPVRCHDHSVYVLQMMRCLWWMSYSFLISIEYWMTNRLLKVWAPSISSANTSLNRVPFAIGSQACLSISVDGNLFITADQNNGFISWCQVAHKNKDKLNISFRPPSWVI